MKTLLIFLLLFSFLFTLGCGGVTPEESLDEPSEEQSKEEKAEEIAGGKQDEAEEVLIAVIVNSTPVTEKEIEMYMRTVALRRAEENLSSDRIREMATERAIREVIISDYFDEKELTVSEEEIEKELLSRINSHPEAETEEEYFEIMAMQGIDREQILKEAATTAKILKLVRIKMEETTEEELLDYYAELAEEAKKQGIDLLPFEELEDIAEIYATRMVLGELDEYREKANIQLE